MRVYSNQPVYIEPVFSLEKFFSQVKYFLEALGLLL